MLDRAENDLSLLDGAFGTITCRKCGSWWVQEYAPEQCPEYSTKLTDSPGQGLEPLISSAEHVGLPVKSVTCSKCGMRYFAHPSLTKCFRCQDRLPGAARPGLLRRIGQWAGRLLGR